MGRKKKKCRAWKQKMRARSKRRSPYLGISPGRLAAWADWPEQEPKIFYPDRMVNGGNGGYGNHAEICNKRTGF